MPRNKQFSEEVVIDKAVQAFWNNGYDATTMRQLETEMGINQFSIYSSFGNKKELFLKVLDRYKTAMKQNYMEILLQSEGRKDDFKIFMFAFVAAVRSGLMPNGCLLTSTAISTANQDVDIKNKLKLGNDEIKAGFLETLTKAKANNHISENADIEKYANYLVVSMQGLCVASKVLDDKALFDYIEVTINSIPQ